METLTSTALGKSDASKLSRRSEKEDSSLRLVLIHRRLDMKKNISVFANSSSSHSFASASFVSSFVPAFGFGFAAPSVAPHASAGWGRKHCKTKI